MAKYLDPRADLTFNSFLDNVSVGKTLVNARKRAENRLEEAEERLKAAVERIRAAEERLKATEERLKAAEAKLRQKDIDTASKLKAMGMLSIEQMAEITGLSVEYLSSL